MSELNPETDASTSFAKTSELRPSSAKPSRVKTLLYAFGALLLLGATLAWLFTRQSGADGQARDALPANPPQAVAFDAASLVARLDDAQQINRVLREQALALSQRMDLLEDTVAGLRRGVAPSAESFKLDEAQYLLSLAETRLDLFSDPHSAARALELADNLLAGISDPALANVRQTLSIELDVVRAAPMNDVPALSGRLRALVQELATLPILTDAPNTTGSRLMQALDRYLVVRREGEAMPVLGRSPWAVREGLTLEFERAQLALERQQPHAWQNALETAVTLAERGLMPEDTAVESFLSRLRALAKTALAPDPPKLGATLRALRRLREGPPRATLATDTQADNGVQAEVEAGPGGTAVPSENLATDESSTSGANELPSAADTSSSAGGSASEGETSGATPMPSEAPAATENSEGTPPQ